MCRPKGLPGPVSSREGGGATPPRRPLSSYGGTGGHLRLGRPITCVECKHE